MKEEKTIGILWLVIGLLHIISGVYNLHQYSTPGLLWMFIIPEMTSYTQIVSGTLCLIIGLSFINEKLENTYLILPLVLLQIIDFLVDNFPISLEFIKYGIFAIIESYDKLIILILIAISFLVFKLQTNTFAKKFIENRANVIISAILILLPYLLSKIAPYKFYEFLH